MTSINEGDEVRVKDSGPRGWVGSRGEVKKSLLSQGRCVVRLTSASGPQTTRDFDVADLEKVQK